MLSRIVWGFGGEEPRPAAGRFGCSMRAFADLSVKKLVVLVRWVLWLGSGV